MMLFIKYIGFIVCVFGFCFSAHAADITYTYDDLNRLERAEYSDGTVYTYTYDEVGNRLSHTAAPAPPPAAPAEQPAQDQAA